MISGLYTAASGMAAFQTKLDVLANNLANVDTPGFKADLFTLVPSGTSPLDTDGAASPTGSVEPGQTALDLSPGVLKHTGNPLDLAIAGPGLFAVETGQGVAYTRAGNFSRSAEGFLVTPEGFRVLGTNGPIRLPEQGVSVDARGQVSASTGTEAARTEGQLRIVVGPALGSLTKVGANLYVPTDGAGAPRDLAEPTIVQGALEASNVNVVRSMVEMLATMRSFEAYQKTIQAIDQTAGQAAGDLGRA
jgi:flagellar basal-body rod protein FlgG